MLRYSFGINRKEQINEDNSNSMLWTFRAVPSAGGLFPSELYVVIINSQIPKGLYHYRPDINSLELMKDGDFTDLLISTTNAEPYIDSLDKVGCAVFTTSLIERVYIKYGERSYRFMIMEVGFIAQNMSLVAEALDLGTCMIGGYLDDEVNEFLGIDGVLESVQNVIIIGAKA